MATSRRKRGEKGRKERNKSDGRKHLLRRRNKFLVTTFVTDHRLGSLSRFGGHDVALITDIPLLAWAGLGIGNIGGRGRQQANGGRAKVKPGFSELSEIYGRPRLGAANHPSMGLKGTASENS